jgi:hypothetical protein
MPPFMSDIQLTKVSFISMLTLRHLSDALGDLQAMPFRQARGRSANNTISEPRKHSLQFLSYQILTTKKIIEHPTVIVREEWCNATLFRAVLYGGCTRKAYTLPISLPWIAPFPRRTFCSMACCSSFKRSRGSLGFSVLLMRARWRLRSLWRF